MIVRNEDVVRTSRVGDIYVMDLMIGLIASATTVQFFEGISDGAQGQLDIHSQDSVEFLTFN